MTTTEVLLSLGSNLGDRKALVDAAVAALAALPETKLGARSSYYRTEPVGPVKQQWFLNIAVMLRTGQSQRAMLAACKTIEAELGRDRSVEIRWGPRPIDIDVLAYGDAAVIDDRAFVVVPLAEIAPQARIGDGTVADFAKRTGNAGIDKLDWPVPALN